MHDPTHPLPASLTPTEADESSTSSHHTVSTDTDQPPATQPSDSCDCFAHLRPANLEACLAFDEVASEIKNAPDAFPYHRNFISIETIVPLGSLQHPPRPAGDDDNDEEDPPLSQSQSQSQSGFFPPQASATETETDEETATQDPRLVWTGHYRFSLDAPLELPPLGWRVGSGRWKKSNKANPSSTSAPTPVRSHGGVDLLLAKTRVPASGLAGLHARFAFERNGAFMLVVENPRRPVVVLGDESFDAGGRVLAKPRCRIGLGNLAYVFEYVVRSGGPDRERAFQQRLGRFLRETFSRERGAATPPRELLASPAEADHPLCDWLIRGTVGRGAFGTVTAARHRVTGRIAAAKMVVRTQSSVRECMREIDICAKVPEHPNLSTLIDTIYERGERWYTGPRPERVWLISSPFVRDTLAAHIQSSPSASSSSSSSSSAAPPVLTLPPQLFHLRLHLFHQLLSGLAHLHAHGFIHRDIKPANIGIVSMPPISSSPSHPHSLAAVIANNNAAAAAAAPHPLPLLPRVIILDFGHAIRAPRASPRPGAVGTVPYLAPEMERAAYGPGVDVWALGVVGWQLFVHKALPWRRAVVPEEKGEEGGAWRARRVWVAVADVGVG
ncbi:hypothetical protein SLS58_003143 [Diplodia intermedia]|uniref:Protein kinase domain-containing protein n=1 Tax=Diplodia intermedia TaxID=856260 RepID=A0ABR3TWZ8_9PEZI